MPGNSSSKSVGRRLRELSPENPTRKNSPTADATHGEVIDALRKLVDRSIRRHADHVKVRTGIRRPIEEVVSGSYVETASGPVFVSTTRYALKQPLGPSAPGLIELDRECPSALCGISGGRNLCGAPLSRLVYLDTETTGLATTSGTYAFLVGLGFMEGDVFRVDQIYMRDHADEPALLQLLGDRLREFDGMVTYNGRSYDIPLLQARFITNREFNPPLPVEHLDLLYAARRLWKGRNTGCRLIELEQEILGITREGDIPGHLIPGLYFDAIRTDDASHMAPVFHHNRLDITSLAALTIQASRLLNPESYQSEGFDLEWRGEDVAGAARVFEKLGLQETTFIYRSALDGKFRVEDHKYELLCRLSRIHRREGDTENVLPLLEQVISDGGCYRPYALIERAKLLEHGDADYETAHQLTNAAISILSELGTAYNVSYEFRVSLDAAHHRLRRLEARKAGLPWHPGTHTDDSVDDFSF